MSDKRVGKSFRGKFAFCAGLLMIALLVGCATQPEITTPTESPSAVVPSATKAPSSTAEPSLSPTVSPSLMPGPTPTPTPAALSAAPVELPSLFTGALPSGAIARLGKGSFTSIELSPDGTLLAVGTTSGLTLYDAISLQELWSDGTASIVKSLDWSADSTMIAGSFENSPVVITWNALSGKRLYTLAGHTNNISDLEWSPVESLLASAALDGAIILWDGETGTRLRTLARTDEGDPEFSYKTEGFYAVWFTFSPDGTMIVSESLTGNASEGIRSEFVFVWDVQTGQQLHLLESASVGRLTWSADSKQLATNYQIWDVLTGQKINASEKMYSDDGCPMTPWPDRNWSPEGGLLAMIRKTDTGVHTGYLDMCNGSGELVYTVEGIYDFGKWSPDGQQFIARTDPDNRLVIYSASGEPLHVLGHKENCIYTDCSIRNSPDWTRFYYRTGKGYYQEILEAWNINDELPGKVVATDSIHVLEVAWSSDGKRLVTIPDEDNWVAVWDIESLKPIRVFEGDYYTWSPDLQMVAGTGGERFLIQETHADKMIEVDTRGEFVISLAWSPEGNYLASGGERGLHLWDSTNGELIRRFSRGSTVIGISWSPNGGLLAAVERGDKVVFWDVSHDEQVLVHEIDSTSPYLYLYDQAFAEPLVWSQDGDRVAFAEPDKNIVIYSTNPPKLIQRVETQAELITNLSLSPDGTRIATITEQEGWFNTFRVWDVSSGELLWERQSPESPIDWREGLKSIDWSPDGKYIATGTTVLSYSSIIESVGRNYSFAKPGQVYLLDAETGHQLSTLEGHTGGVEDVAFSPDGAVLASASLDGTVILWDMSQH